MAQHEPKGYRLLVFDWDGTLEDSIAPLIDNISQTLLGIGKVPPPAEKIRGVIGLNLESGLAQLYPTEDASKLATQCHRFAKTRSAKLNKALQPPLFPGVRELLNDWQTQGFWLAVATGKSREGLNQALQRHSLENFFMTTRTADDARSKPHPEMLESILSELGVRPHEALMMGDTYYDLAMAHNSGVDCIGIGGGVHSIAKLESTGYPLSVVSNFSGLAPLIKISGS